MVLTNKTHQRTRSITSRAMSAVPKNEVSKQGNPEAQMISIPIPPPGGLLSRPPPPAFLAKESKCEIVPIDEERCIDSIVLDWQMKVKQICWSFFNFQFQHKPELLHRLNRIHREATSKDQSKNNNKVLTALVMEYYCTASLDEMKTNFWSTAGKNLDKNDAKADEHRIRGNAQYSNTNYRLAINEYTLAAMYATDSSANCSKAFANRSAAFFQLRMFESCLVDIDQALEANYHCPDRLYYRKIEALIHLNRLTQALELMAKHVDPSGNPEKYKKIIQEIEFKKNSKIQSIETPLEHMIEQPTNVKVVEPEQVFRFMKKVRIEKSNNPLQRTRVIAEEPIEMGDCIFEEWSAERMLYSNYEKWFCHQCLCRLRSDNGLVYDHYLRMVPTFVCKKCFNVLFCSRQCRDKAMAQHHQFLCRFPNFNLDANYVLGEERPMHDTYARVALRLLFSQNLRTLYQVAKEYYQQTGVEDLTLPEVDETRWLLPAEAINLQWATIFALPVDYATLDKKIVNSYALTSALTMHMIIDNAFLPTKLTEAFGWDPEVANSIPSWSKFLGGVLLRLFLQFKQFTVFRHPKASDDFVFRYQMDILGRLVLPNVAQFRPSCRPNMELVSSLGGELIRFHARVKIEPGQEITRTTDYEYPEKGFEDRQLIFSLLYNRPCLCDWCSYEGRYLYIINQAPPSKRKFGYYIPLLWHDHKIGISDENFICTCGCKRLLDSRRVKTNMIKAIDALDKIGDAARDRTAKQFETMFLAPLSNLVHLDGYQRLTAKVYPTLAIKYYNARAFDDARFFMDKCLEGHFVQMGDGACLSQIAAMSTFLFYYGVWRNRGGINFSTIVRAAEFANERIERFCLVRDRDLNNACGAHRDYWASARLMVLNIWDELEAHWAKHLCSQS